MIIVQGEAGARLFWQLMRLAAALLLAGNSSPINADDGDHHQQFDEREARTVVFVTFS